MVLVRSTASPAEARRVLDGVYLLTAREAYRVRRHVLERDAGPPARLPWLCGVGPGAVEAETAEGVWHVLAGDADAVFDPDPSSTWQRQIARTELIQARGAEPARRPWVLSSPSGRW